MATINKNSITIEKDGATQTVNSTELFNTIDRADTLEQAQKELGDYLPEFVIRDLYDYYNIKENLDHLQAQAQHRADMTGSDYRQGFADALDYIANNIARLDVADLPSQVTNILA